MKHSSSPASAAPSLRPILGFFYPVAKVLSGPDQGPYSHLKLVKLMLLLLNSP